MKALFLSPKAKALQKIEIENTLSSLQKKIGGYIEAHHVGQGVIAIMDEEGKLKNLAPNYLDDQYGMLYGNIIFVGVDHDCGVAGMGDDFCSISEDQIEFIKDYLSIRRFVREGESDGNSVPDQT